jgi:hypothetical protein
MLAITSLHASFVFAICAIKLMIYIQEAHGFFSPLKEIPNQQMKQITTAFCPIIHI